MLLYSSDGAGRSATRRAFEIWFKHAQKGAALGGAAAVALGTLFVVAFGAGVVGAFVASLAGGVPTAVWWLRKPSGAKRWLQGAKAEIATAHLLRPLIDRGWKILHDLKLNSKRVKWQWDHIAVPPSGDFLVYIDTKSWQARRKDGSPQRVRWEHEKLMYGPWDNTSKMRTVEFEARRLAEETGLSVIPVVAVEGATVTDSHGTPTGFFQVGATYVISTRVLCGSLAAMDAGFNDRQANEVHRALRTQFIAA